MLAIAVTQDVPKAFEPPVVSRMAAQMPLGQCCTNDELGAVSVSPVLTIGLLGLVAIGLTAIFIHKRETGDW